MLALVFFVVLGVVMATAVQFEKGQEYSVVCNKKHARDCELRAGKIPFGQDSHAYGTYVDDIMTDGWGKLWVHGDDSIEGWFQAGFLEGALTSLRVYQHYVSWFDFQFGSKPLTENTTKFMYDQYAFTKKLVADPELRKEVGGSDAYYATLGKLVAQFEGLLAGVNYAAADPSEQLTLLQLLLLEASGDLYDIVPAVDPQAEQLRIGKMSAQEFFDKWHERISCSALVKIPSDFSDLYAGHTTWTSYQNMLRIYKNYDLDGGRYLSSHSSKPGMLYSKDDFYALPRTKLVVLETTNGVLNTDLYKFVTPRSLLTWQRVPVANTLAETSQEWTDIFKLYNSGTYANQWMVVDMKLFEQVQKSKRLGMSPANVRDLMWIIEVAPNVAVAQDVSSLLLSARDGENNYYWPSYNVPYDKKVYEITGFQQAYETYGDSYSYTNCTRAQIFRRDAPSVQTFEGVQNILRYNDYTKDPLSAGNAGSAISARYDLRVENPRSYGGVDTKVTSWTRVTGKVQAALASAESGPTHDDIAPFQWSTSAYNNQVHVGQPDLFNFGFVEMDYNLH